MNEHINTTEHYQYKMKCNKTYGQELKISSAQRLIEINHNETLETIFDVLDVLNRLQK